MNWWSSIVDGTKRVWNHATREQLSTYAYNTGDQMLNQVKALGSALPALLTPESMKVVRGMSSVVAYEVFPMFLAYTLNNSLQTHLYDEKNPGNAPWSTFCLSTLSSVASWMYILQKAPALATHTFILDSLSIGAFNKHKADDPLAPSCTNCNTKRFAKGEIILLPAKLGGNYLLAFLLEYVPYVGKMASMAVITSTAGGYIAESVTPERCARHKALMLETLLALGINYALSTLLIDQLLRSTIGLPPVIVYRSLLHLVLLLHINAAAHQHIPTAPQQLSISRNPLTHYENSVQFVADALFTKFVKKFQPQEDAQPIMTISSILPVLTKVFNYDTQTQESPFPAALKPVINILWPTPYVSAKAFFVDDRVVQQFWPDIHKPMLDIITLIERKGITIRSLANSPVPGSKEITEAILSRVLHNYFKLSTKTTELIIELSGKPEFWQALLAYRQWLVRQQKIEKQVLAPVSAGKLASLNDGSSSSESHPPTIETTALTTVDQFKLQSPKSEITPEKLMPKTVEPVVPPPTQPTASQLQPRAEAPVIDPHKLLGTRHRFHQPAKKAPAVNDEPMAGPSIFD